LETARSASGLSSDSTRPRVWILREFLDQHYEAWMKAMHRGRAAQVARVRWAFKDLLDPKLSEITTGPKVKPERSPLVAAAG